MTSFTTYATATFATGNTVVVASADNMFPGLPITFAGNTFGGITLGSTYYIGNITFGYPTSTITLTSLPGGAVFALANGTGNMSATFSQGGQNIISTVPPGEPLNEAFDAININFDQIWAAGPVGSNIQIDENTIYTLNTNGNLVLNPNGIGNVVANAHVVPDQDRVRNLGASTLRWNTIYAQNIVGNISGNIVAGGSNGQIQFNNNGVLAGANGFVFNSNTNSVSLSGTITAGNVLTPGIVSSTSGVYGDIYTTMIDSGDSSAILVLSEVNLLADLTVSQGLQVDQDITATGNVTGGNLLFGSGIVSGTGNIYADKIFANIQGNVDAAGNLYEVQFNTTGDQLGANANFTYDFANNILTVNNANILTGNVSAVGNITANYYFGNGSQLTGITADAVNAANLVGNTLNANVLFSSLTTLGNLVSVSVVGNTITGNLNTAGSVSAVGNVTGGNVLFGSGVVSGTGNIYANKIFANIQGNVDAAGNLNEIQFNTTGDQLGASSNFTYDAANNVFTVNSGNIIGGNLTTTGSAGNISGSGNVLAGGYISATGNITGNYFIGNGRFLTGIDTTQISNGNTNVQAYANGNVAITVSGISNTVVFTSTGINATGTLSVAGTITGGNLETVGYVSATGNVSGSNVNTPTIFNSGDLQVVPTGNISLGGGRYINNVNDPVQNQDAATKNYVDNMVSTAISYHDAVFAATTETLAAATGGTITYNQPGGAGNGIGATLTTTGSFNLIDTANVQTANLRILVKNEANAAHNGVYVWSNATVITRSSDTNTYGTGNASALGLNDYFFVTDGNINKGSAWVVDAPTGTITFGTSNIAFAQFSSSQTYTANANAGLTLTGTVFSAKVDNNTTAFDVGGNISVKPGANLTTPNIGAATGTSVSLTGNVISGNVQTIGTVSATGNITGNFFIGNGSQLTGVTATGVDANNLTGNTLSSNVVFSSLTSLGVLTLLSATGNIETTANVSASGNVTGANILTGGLISAAGNVDAGNISVSGNVTGGNVLFGAGLVSGTGNIFADTIFANISGNIDAAGNLYEIQFNTSGDQLGANANFTYDSANNVFTVNGGNAIAGNFLTAGLISATGNVFGNWFVGNVDATIISASGNVTGANIITSGAGGDISGSGNILAGGLISATGNITGNYFIGNGAFLTGIDTTLISNGNTNVQTYANGNVAVTVSGIANTVIFTVDGVDVVGNVSANNVIVGNITIPSTGNVTLGNVNINNLAEPVANSDAATKFYVDSVAANVLPIISNQTITPDGSNNTFVLNQTATAVGILLTINGVTQTPTTNYTVTGNSLTINETPLSSDIIQVRYLSGTQVGGSGGLPIANGNSNIDIATINGNVTVTTAGTHTWTFDDAGNLLLPQGGIVYETSIPGGTLAGNTIALKPQGGIDADQQLLIYPTAIPGTDANHLHLTSGNLYNTELFLGSDDLYVKLANTGNVVVNSNDGAGSTAQWTFDYLGQLKVANLSISATSGIGEQASIVENNGSLAVLANNTNGVVNIGWANNASALGDTAVVWFNEPGNVGNVVVRTGNTAATSYTWAFDNTGNLTAPGNISATGNITAGNFTGNTAGFAIGYRDIPQVSFSANATAALTDAGKHYYSTTAGNLALTLPDNVSVAFPTGAALTIVVNAAGNVLVNQGTGVSLYQAGSSTTGNRVVGAYGLATVMKVAANTWVISGTGVY